jgi:hypothetical protein
MGALMIHMAYCPPLATAHNGIDMGRAGARNAGFDSPFLRHEGDRGRQVLAGSTPARSADDPYGPLPLTCGGAIIDSDDDERGTGMNESDFRDYDVQLTIIVNMNVAAHNPEFTSADARETAIGKVVDAIEQYVGGDVSVYASTVVEQ